MKTILDPSPSVPAMPDGNSSAPRVHVRRSTCRICGHENLRPFLSLGSMPLANSFLHAPEEFADEPRYPLDVYFCEDCALVQLLDVIDPRVLFSHYNYVTGTSETMAAHNVDCARAIVNLLKLEAQDLVVEVASNDGSLLKCFTPYGVRTLGVEPATNIVEIARGRGIETLDQFFDWTTARHVRAQYGPARVVIGNNVLAHVDDSPDFLRACKELLGQDGLIVIEVPYLRDLLDHLEYDTIYHEHLSYFSVTTLLHLYDVAGLSIVRLEYVPVHGGSLRIYAGRPENYGAHSRTVLAWVEEERHLGLTEFVRYEGFAHEVACNRHAVRELLERLKREGRTAAGYGAPAKGNTLLNYCGIGPDLLQYTVDKSSLKVGSYTPGMHIPVLPVSTLLERQPDYVLIMAWNFAEEIIRQQQAYGERGGNFIIPLPQPRIV